MSGIFSSSDRRRVPKLLSIYRYLLHRFTQNQYYARRTRLMYRRTRGHLATLSAHFRHPDLSQDILLHQPVGSCDNEVAVSTQITDERETAYDEWRFWDSTFILFRCFRGWHDRHDLVLCFQYQATRREARDEARNYGGGFLWIRWKLDVSRQVIKHGLQKCLP